MMTEHSAAAFAPNAVAIRVGEFVVDEETGELLDWPDGIGPDRIDALQSAHLLAREQEAQWKLAKQAMGRAVGAALGRLGLRRFDGDRYRSWVVADSEVAQVTERRVMEALDAEILSLDELERLRSMAVREYDPKTVSALVQSGDLSERAAKFIVTRIARAGYTQTEPAKQLAPRVEREPRV